MQTKFVNKRKYKRHVVTNNIFVVCQQRAGQVINISEGGMGIEITSYYKSLSDDWADEADDFPCLSINKQINGLPLQLVRREDIKLPRFGGFATQVIGVKFNNPSLDQQSQIRQQVSGFS